MELLEGSALRDRISNHRLSLREVLEYAVQIADGLESAHSKGIVHGDIKPANIFLTKRGLVKILDFGLAKMTPADSSELPVAVGASDSRTRSGPVAGTVAYMSPEQVRGESLDPRSDLFSLGVVLYEMVTGHRPFRGDNDAEVAEAILKHAPPVPIRVRPKSPARLHRIISRCLEKDRNRRYGKASEIHSDLRRLEHDIRTGARRRTLISVGAAAVLVLAAAYFFVPRAPKLTDRDSIVVADFVNKTGDSVFDGTLREGLAVQLGQSPFLSVVREDRIQNTLRWMNRSPEAPLTPQLAREICERIGSAAVLQGSIARMGTQYVLGTGEQLPYGSGN